MCHPHGVLFRGSSLSSLDNRIFCLVYSRQGNTFCKLYRTKGIVSLVQGTIIFLQKIGLGKGTLLKIWAAQLCLKFNQEPQAPPSHGSKLVPIRTRGACHSLKLSYASSPSFSTKIPKNPIVLKNLVHSFERVLHPLSGLAFLFGSESKRKKSQLTVPPFVTLIL